MDRKSEAAGRCDFALECRSDGSEVMAKVLVRTWTARNASAKSRGRKAQWEPVLARPHCAIGVVASIPAVVAADVGTLAVGWGLAP